MQNRLKIFYLIEILKDTIILLFTIIKLFISEIIGYVDGIESPRYVGNKQQYKFFKFYMNNGKGKRIQVVAWNDDIDYIQHHIMVNHVSTFYYFLFVNFFIIFLPSI